MITLTRINTESKHYLWTEQLWIASFPENERRDTDAQRSNADNNRIFNYMLATENGMPIGLFTYWDFGKFIYCEHFATSPDVRGKGYGAEIVRQILEQTAKPLVLEVEMPEDELCRRRIKFYERAGMRLWIDSNYVQPPYREGGEPIPMLLMASEGLNESTDFEAVAATLRKNVYGIAGL